MLIWALIVFMAGQNNVPRSAILSYGVIAAVAIWASRMAAAWFLKTVRVGRAPKFYRERKAVLVDARVRPGSNCVTLTPF